MNKIFAAVLCLAVPGLVFLNAWQGYRYSALADKVDELEKQQKDLLSANRDIIGQIAYETSPARVAEKAAALGLVPADATSVAGASGVRVTRLQAGPDSTGGPAQ
jgi:hypothetical protein